MDPTATGLLTRQLDANAAVGLQPCTAPCGGTPGNRDPPGCPGVCVPESATAAALKSDQGRWASPQSIQGASSPQMAESMVALGVLIRITKVRQQRHPSMYYTAGLGTLEKHDCKQQ